MFLFIRRFCTSQLLVMSWTAGIYALERERERVRTGTMMYDSVTSLNKKYLIKKRANDTWQDLIALG